MSKYEKIELTNMCMIYDNNGNVVVQDKINQSWSGITFPGGHIEKQESFVDSVIREVKEETGLIIKNPKLCGIKWWEVKRNKRYVVLLFKTNEYSGTLKSSNEGKVFWTKLETLKTLNLAESFDKIIDVFCEDNVQEYIQRKDNDKCIDLFKKNKKSPICECSQIGGFV
ncbi:8-oxo-dGTP diphosphatase [Eubacterium coprostanoligenes]|uniref:8-oxo-dGTP diphosphatase n=1 Tax=Eubacterium coprostanoligenes TaxID=290054 RepID=UPI002352459E|nr:8-oxo-dGTP diphosphatase [Eubacterium coprostanoligenes]MCI6353960.1 8-oxo-dGTP diphosphatase [Eubacterium coprostanoligenes]